MLAIPLLCMMAPQAQAASSSETVSVLIVIPERPDLTPSAEEETGSPAAAPQPPDAGVAPPSDAAGPTTEPPGSAPARERTSTLIEDGDRRILLITDTPAL